MTIGQTFEELSKAKHDRGSFDCGEPEPTNFLKTQALKHMHAGVSKTLVLPGGVLLMNQKFPICAFYSVAPSSISRERLPSEPAKKLPRYPVPVFLIAQLAVDKDLHGLGIGKISLIRALHYLLKVNAYMRAYAVVVDCLTESVQTFYAKYGFYVLGERNGRIQMFLPMKTISQLFTEQE